MLLNQAPSFANQPFTEQKEQNYCDGAVLTTNINTHDHNYFINKKEHSHELSLTYPV